MSILILNLSILILVSEIQEKNPSELHRPLLHNVTQFQINAFFSFIEMVLEETNETYFTYKHPRPLFHTSSVRMHIPAANSANTPVISWSKLQTNKLNE